MCNNIIIWQCEWPLFGSASGHPWQCEWPSMAAWTVRSLDTILLSSTCVFSVTVVECHIYLLFSARLHNSLMYILLICFLVLCSSSTTFSTLFSLATSRLAPRSLSVSFVLGVQCLQVSQHVVQCLPAYQHYYYYQ